MDHIPRTIIEQAFRALPRASLTDRLHAMRALGEARGMRYVDDAGRRRTIDMALTPWVLTSAQLLHFHRVIRALADALLRAARLRDQLPAVREIIRFSPERDAWMRLASHPRSRPLAVIGRLDSTATYDHAAWRAGFRMLEPNSVGVGGVHYAPAGCSIALDVVGDVLTRALPGRAITATPDPRRLLLEELRHVARTLGRPVRSVALIENMEDATGTDEFGELAAHLSAQGLQAVVADPRQVHPARGGGLLAKGVPVDVLYRDTELSELVEMEAGGRRLTGMREAVRQGRLISSLTWEIDQKSAWELFTDARFAKAFTPSQRALFRQHVLWTRLVRQARVSGPSGELVDLVPFIRRRQAQLVLKPNTLFGGEGVVLGRTVSRAEWERHLRRALSGRERYVVQQVARIASETFPALEDGGARWVSRHVVSGFYFSSSGIGLVGRFSGHPVVNVSRGGGLIPALWVH